MQVESAAGDSAACIVCQVPAKQFCSACKLVKYCGPDHQRAHWKQHKLECRPFRVANDPVLGRHLVITRDIQANSVIFTEAPLVVGPKWYLTDKEKQVPVMPCVGCFTPCRIGVHFCTRCRWPACSPVCAGLTNPNLHGLECSILMLGHGPSNPNDMRCVIDYYRSDALMVLKCLILQRQNPKKWTELMDMQSHETERKGSELHNEAETRIVSYLQKNFLNRLQTIQHKSKELYIKEYDATVLHRICGIIETNYMCISLATGLELSGVFYTACMMEHACRPNSYFHFDHSNGFRIVITAGRDMQKGEHIKIMYSNILWGTQMRHEHLQLTKHFKCKCERCLDPTEYGSYLSALACVGDMGRHCGGLQLPQDPLNPKTDWACIKCPMIVRAKDVRFLLTQITDEVDELLARVPSIAEVEALIEKLSQFLHPHHYHMFRLKHSLIQLYGTQLGHTMDVLNDNLMNHKMQMCEELYATCQKLDPDTLRLSIYVGIILYEMHNVLVTRGKRLMIMAQGQPALVAQALDNFKMARDNLLKAAKVLSKEVDNVAGHNLRDAVMLCISQLDNMIKTP